MTLCADPACDWFATEHDDHPCGLMAERPGQPCRYCGREVLVSEDACPDCWVPIAEVHGWEHEMSTPTPEEWSAAMDAERARQVADGYDDAHDAKHGVEHLLDWAIDYDRRGNSLAAATMTRCALRLMAGSQP